MKTKKQVFFARLKTLLFWLFGTVTGMFLYYILSLAQARNWNIGGELLFIPFLLMICWLWYSIGKDCAAREEYQRGKVDGYHQGTHDIAAAMEERHHETEELWAKPDI